MSSEDTTASTLAEALELLGLLVDEDKCWFDHNGSCQAHSWFYPEPGEICPHERAKRLLESVQDLAPRVERMTSREECAVRIMDYRGAAEELRADTASSDDSNPDGGADG